MIESGLLRALFLGIIGGAAVAANWWFIESAVGQRLRDRLAAWLGYFGLEPPEVTRYLAVALSAIVSLAVYIVTSDRLNFWVFFAMVFIGSQVCHARHKTQLALRQRMHPIDPTTTTEDALLVSADDIFPVGDGGYAFWDKRSEEISC